MKTRLAASDRKSLIRLASSLPKGSGERRVILAALKNARSYGNLELIDFKWEVSKRHPVRLTVRTGVAGLYGPWQQPIRIWPEGDDTNWVVGDSVGGPDWSLRHGKAPGWPNIEPAKKAAVSLYERDLEKFRALADAGSDDTTEEEFLMIEQAIKRVKRVPTPSSAKLAEMDKYLASPEVSAHAEASDRLALFDTMSIDAGKALASLYRDEISRQPVDAGWLSSTTNRANKYRAGICKDLLSAIKSGDAPDLASARPLIEVCRSAALMANRAMRWVPAYDKSQISKGYAKLEAYFKKRQSKLGPALRFFKETEDLLRQVARKW